MAKEIGQLQHPDTGEVVQPVNAKEYNNLRYGAGYQPVQKKQAPQKAQPQTQPTPKPDQG